MTGRAGQIKERLGDEWEGGGKGSRGKGEHLGAARRRERAGKGILGEMK